MVNRGDGKGRKAANVTAVRAVFLDLDEAPLAPVMAAPIPPAIVCESSPGKHHAYWPVADMPLGDFKRAQQSLRSEEHTSELQSLMRTSYAVFCLKKKKKNNTKDRQQLKHYPSKQLPAYSITHTISHNRRD